MPEYRISDLRLLPNLLSVARVPLAVAFPLYASNASNAAIALGVLGAAGVTDVLDGWLARKLDQATPTGAMVDGIADKVFAASVLGTLVASERLSPFGGILRAPRRYCAPRRCRTPRRPRARSFSRAGPTCAARRARRSRAGAARSTPR